ncbi:unnamed protein product [Ascophyllum nodosum]
MPLVVRWISINNGLCFLRLNKPWLFFGGITHGN